MIATHYFHLASRRSEWLPCTIGYWWWCTISRHIFPSVLRISHKNKQRNGRHVFYLHGWSTLKLYFWCEIVMGGSCAPRQQQRERQTGNFVNLQNFSSRVVSQIRESPRSFSHLCYLKSPPFKSWKTPLAIRRNAEIFFSHTEKTDKREDCYKCPWTPHSKYASFLFWLIAISFIILQCK